MKILAIDTTGSVSSVAVVSDKFTISEFTINNKKTHSETLMPMIEMTLKYANTEMEEIDYIACSNGPGSFTGIRIGVATAKALAHGCNKKIVSVPTLDILAYNIFDSKKLIVPIIDARRNEVYSAFYMWEGSKLLKISDYKNDNIDVILQQVKEIRDCAIFVGDGIFNFESKILENKFDISPTNMNLQRASSVGSYAFNFIQDAVSYTDFKPFYLRETQAQREYERKNLCVK